jgi:hypothetical protein
LRDDIYQLKLDVERSKQLMESNNELSLKPGSPKPSSPNGMKKFFNKPPEEKEK